MQLIDWVIVILYFAASAWIGVRYASRAGESVEEFFLSGRSLPWWLAGTSMVATTFAADTPLAVTELVARNGVAGNWLWWSAAIGGMLTVFFFARLWRRAGILTDVELVELRYSGKPAAFLRGFRALYLGIFMNGVIMAWVNLAMGTVLEGMFGITREQMLLYVGLALAITAAYSATSGMWGVALTDAFQFALAMVGTTLLAVIVLRLPAVGGIDGLTAKLPEWSLRFTPEVGREAGAGETLALSVAAFVAFVGVQWWSSWYPGAEPGGGGYVAQRMMSAKDERHSLFATLWFTIAHYCLRPWPWILVGLATLVLYPELGTADKKLGYVYAMRDHLPTGLRGALVASFFAAYMSTIATQLNWGTSYVINDFYGRFVKKDAGQKDLVFASRVTTVLLMAISLGIMMMLDTISGAWSFILEASAGLGLVLILRWFWWRVNAWSEIVAMLAALGTYAYLRLFTAIQSPYTLFVIVAVSTVAWITATFLTPPVDRETLRAFYRRVHPGGPGWAAIAREVPDVTPDQGLGGLVVDWLAGVALVYATLFAIGAVLFGRYGQAAVCVVIAAAAVAIIYRDLARRPGMLAG
ncbi:MAG TPA: sodium:solute symporter family protein [Vicinamibacteria bacterium]|nr:sodium:solute symporter family protein [Vicinamibacteria bacterium]